MRTESRFTEINLIKSYPSFPTTVIGKERPSPIKPSLTLLRPRRRS